MKGIHMTEKGEQSYDFTSIKARTTGSRPKETENKANELADEPKFIINFGWFVVHEAMFGN